MALDTTPGGKTANSYATLAEFAAYAAARLPAVSWYGTATDAQKEAALQAAARELDACFAWTGAAVDPASDDATAHQALTWPRSGMLSRNGFAIDESGADSIPIDLKNAQCEMALQLGAGDRLGDNDPLKKGITSIKAGSVELKFSDVLGQQTTREAANVRIRQAQSDLNYASDVVPAEVRRLLVPSWFEQNMIDLPMIFDPLGGCSGSW